MLFGVEEHGSAYAVVAVGATQYVDILASVASVPERVVVGELGKCHRFVAQLGVHGHHSSTACQREYLRIGPSGAGKRESEVLDFLCYATPAEVGMNNQTARGDILLVFPRLDIAESCKAVATLIEAKK